MLVALRRPERMRPRRRSPRPSSKVSYQRFAVLLVAVAACACGLPAATPTAPPSIHIRNLGQVNDHILRGAQPEEQGLRELASNHVTMVIDLREPGAVVEAERRTVEGLGMRFIHVPLPAATAPSPQALARVLRLLTPDDNAKIFVHCLRGKDRTGTVIACYRIQHDGWPPHRALSEAQSYGMSHAELGMRSFILHFRPIDLPVPAPGKP